jgi:hypothetical protein
MRAPALFRSDLKPGVDLEKESINMAAEAATKNIVQRRHRHDEPDVQRVLNDLDAAAQMLPGELAVRIAALLTAIAEMTAANRALLAADLRKLTPEQCQAIDRGAAKLADFHNHSARNVKADKLENLVARDPERALTVLERLLDRITTPAK